MVAHGLRAMRLSAFLDDPARFDQKVSSEGNPFLDDGGLAEAGLLDVRLDWMRSRAWLLFDCKGALQIRAGNTAVLVVNRVSFFSLTTYTAPRKATYPTVLGWHPSVVGGRFTVDAGLLPETDLAIIGEGGEFFVGDVPGMDAAPPNLMTAGDDEITAGFANWSSEFLPIQARFLR